MHAETLTIVGVGLIGGSIALAAKTRGLVRRVRGFGRRAASLERAQALGIIDEFTLDVTAAGAGSQLIVVCTPVDGIVAQILALAHRCDAGTLITDAGSTKADIVRGLDKQLPAGVAFVGSHPLAGSEKRGPEYADANLFHERWTILTPTDHTEPTALERAREFWQALGAQVRLMTPEDHDRALALTSHLPHLVASALAGILPGDVHDLAATGFRSTTRVAAGDPELWSAIFLHNRAAVLTALDALDDRLRAFRAAIDRPDRLALDQLLAEGKKVRDALGS